MISATEAAKLYTQPPFTLEEVEEQIRKMAVTEGYTCFDKARISREVFGALQEAGYVVQTGAENFIVRWK